MQQTRALWFATSVLVLGVVPVHAQVIEADTTGDHNFTDAGYYGVQFVSGGGFVESVTIDLSAHAGAQFDLDGSFSFHSAMTPVTSCLSQSPKCCVG